MRNVYTGVNIACKENETTQKKATYFLKMFQ